MRPLLTSQSACLQALVAAHNGVTESIGSALADVLLAGKEHIHVTLCMHRLKDAGRRCVNTNMLFRALAWRHWNVAVYRSMRHSLLCPGSWARPSLVPVMDGQPSESPHMLLLRNASADS